MKIIDNEIRINRGDRLLIEFLLITEKINIHLKVEMLLNFLFIERKNWTSHQFCKNNLHQQ